MSGAQRDGAARAVGEHEVVIAGGGPTGLMLAGELALAGVDVVVVERRTDQHVDGSRAGGLHSRTIEVLDQRGIADRFLDAGEVMQVTGFAMIRLDIGDFPTRHPYGLALWQSRFEPILAQWVEELGVPLLRGREVVGLGQDQSGVDVEVSDGTTIQGRYLVGCDGGRSVVRKLAGIGFSGLEPTKSWMIAEVEMDEEPPIGFHHDDAGAHAISRRAEGEPLRVLIVEREVGDGSEPTIDDLQAAVRGVYGTDFGLRHASWISRFTDTARQADTYRRGRVLVAGDAAHVHPPQGGQGLNVGVQDAVNLGWKLAQVVAGASGEELLDTYHAERHPVGARVLHNTMAQVALTIPDARHQALREITADLLATDEGRRRIAGMMSGLDVHYDLGEGHPLLGRRMPDLDLGTPRGPTTVFTLLHDARPLLLDLSGAGGFDAAPWPRVRLVQATCDGPWELPVIGDVPAPPAVLLRPDGHVAWVGDMADADLRDALTTWCGSGLSG